MMKLLELVSLIQQVFNNVVKNTEAYGHRQNFVDEMCKKFSRACLSSRAFRIVSPNDLRGPQATEYVHRVGRTARLDKMGEALLFLQPAEIDYLQDLQKHGVSLTEYPILKVLDSFTAFGRKVSGKGFVSLDSHPWILSLQKALEAFILNEPSIHILAKNAYCSLVRAYTAHRGDLKRIFMVKKLHLGHVAKSFALKEQPSLVGQAFQMLEKKKEKRSKA